MEKIYENLFIGRMREWWVKPSNTLNIMETHQKFNGKLMLGDKNGGKNLMSLKRNHIKSVITFAKHKFEYP